ncbi:hypothetical protein [Streptomyces purpureus]|uniref:hypothetical protein n=1 Tax=Streptomyces purpureus TaxID=1951 RepID=UPI000364A494|nr:hypothetical protein [Streptomyces purpureus]
MQRKAYAPGLAALAAALAAGVTGCTAGAGTDGSATDAKAGPAAPAAAPGKYRTLFEPCGSVERTTLRDLLPGAAGLPEEQQARVYRGTAAVTYDTDRRAGCTWKADAPDASHQLRLDFERVVSYDATVSDDDRAQAVYARKQVAAALPAPASSAPASTPAVPSGTPSGTPAKTSSAPSAPASSPSGTGTGLGLEPRVLEGLGDAAFLNDVLTGAGSGAQQRTVSVVFRTSNVIVTVEYVAQPTAPAGLPDSKELQDKAQGLARSLAERFNE